MVQGFSSPGVVHLFYFSELDDQNLKKIWDSFRAVCELDSTASEDVFKEKREKTKLHYIQHVANKKLGLYLFKTRNVHIFEFVLFQEGSSESLAVLWNKGLTQIGELKTCLGTVNAPAFGEATVLVGDKMADDAEDAWRKLDPVDDSGEWPEGEQIQKTEFLGGSLLCLSAESERKHNYYIYLPRDQEYAGTFLLQQLPMIDVYIQKLRVETSYFLEQTRAIEKERKETDKAIDSILHQGLVVASEEVAKIGQLQKQVKDLSHLYGVLAEGAAITKSACHRLKSDIEILEQQLEPLTVDDSPHQVFKTGYLRTFNMRLDRLNMERDLLDHSLENARTALDVVRSRVDLEQSTQSLAAQDQTRKLLDQNIVLQKEGISLQVAAVFIEFVVVFYYSLHSWEILARAEVFHHIPAVVQFMAVLAFATSVILCTHFAAKKIEKPGAQNVGLWLSLLAIFLSFASFVGITFYFSH